MLTGRRGHIPERTCVGCKRRRRRGSLIRIVRTAHRDVVIDASGKMDGRGAYICRLAECFEKARKKKAFARSLRVDEGKIPYEALLSAIEQSDPDYG
jgi:predicted RNA-binding protein YlxR (DUF448 family)